MKWRALLLGALTALAMSVQTGSALGASGVFGTVSVGPSPSVAEFEKMADGGARTVRVPMSWDPSASGPLVGEWERLDAAVEGSAREGLELLPTLIGRRASATTPPEGPAERENWARFLDSAVKRYGPGGVFWQLNPNLPERPIRTWQIWNEQNSPTYWEPEPDPRAYADLVKLSASTIRGVDPGAKIVLGGMFGTPHAGIDRDWYSWVFLRRVLDVPGIRPSFDAYALHPYARSMRGLAFQVRKGRKVIRRAGAKRKPLWITELGWSTVTRSEDPSVPVPANGEAGQARKLRKAFKFLEEKQRRWRLRRVLWFSWRDGTVGGGCASWCDEMGLFRRDLTPKPAWRAFTRFARSD